MSPATQHPTPAQAVIFDLDGTLFDSLDDIAEAMNSVMSSQGFPTHPVSSYRYFVGNGMKKLVCRAIPQEYNERPDIISRCIEQMKSEYERRWCNQSKPYRNIPALLDELEKRGIKMCILSNKPDDFTQAIHDKFFSKWHFAKVLGATAEFPLKPDPRGALGIATAVNIEPESIFYLGDSAVDMMTASNAGMYAIGCLWGFRDAVELQAHGAQQLLSDPLELLDFL